MNYGAHAKFVEKWLETLSSGGTETESSKPAASAETGASATETEQAKA